MRYLLVVVLFFQIACSSSAQQITGGARQTKAERKPFQKGSAVIESPKEYSHRESKNGAKYDPRPRVVLIDEKAGKYELRWIGYDGKEKIIKYQRQDALDALVEARVEKNSEGKFVYKYLIKNLPTSPTYFSGFTVQTLASDVKDEILPTVDDIYIGHMGNYIPDFSKGVWRRFAPLGETSPRIEPGKSIEFSLVSVGVPGIVGCRATAGEHVLKGVGEHMPSELEMSTPGYDGWAKGYTIGPIERLAALNKSERARYVLENLPKFQEVGWMSPATAEIYASILKREDLAGALRQAKRDLENEFITGEVFYIIEGLNQ
jgi:hypothetical protein